MRIVVVTTSFPRTTEDPSGHFVEASAKALADQGHEVHVIAPGGSPFDPPRSRGTLVVHRASGGALFAWPGALERARQAPWRLLSAGPFALGVLARLRAIGPVDRAIAHWIVPSAFPLLYGVEAPLEVVAHGADVRLLLAAPRVFREMVLRALIDRGARFTFAARSLLSAFEGAISSELCEALRFSSKVEPPPIDLPRHLEHRAQELRASQGLAQDERLVVSVGRLVASKRVDLAIDALGELSANFRLVVVGDGPERARLEERARERRLKAHFVGNQPRREALAWIAAADVLVHASAVEAAPSVVREARALGVGVVACEAGDVGAWAKDDRGIQVVAANAEAIAQAIAAAERPVARAPS